MTSSVYSSKKTITESDPQKGKAGPCSTVTHMEIKLYSVRGFIGNALKLKLQEALAANHLPYSVTEINHVDAFIKAKLASVPAFRIGAHIIQHPQDGDIDATIRQVIEYLLHRHLQSVLVPVDFSPESMHAVGYARMMAEALGYGLTLAHVHQTLYDPVSAGALDVQFLTDSNKKLTHLAETYQEEYLRRGLDLKVDAHLEIGEASSSLTELLDEGPYALMVMATKSTDNAMRRLFGTVSSEVSRHSHKPVVVVPPQARIEFPTRMVIGFTEELLMNGVLEYLLQFGSGHGVTYHFVHVDDDPEIFNGLKARLSDRLAPHKEWITGFTIEQLHGADQEVHEALFSYANSSQAGMVVLISHHRGFLENLRHTSVTKKALHQPVLPVMIMHRGA